MNLKTVGILKKELVEKKESLSTLQSQTRKLDNDSDTELKDVVDRSDAEEAWFTKERMSQHWKLELSRINSALHRIELGTFGICEECDDEIPLKRLRVRPDAALCLNCQETNEREVGQIQKTNSGMNLFH
jgi:DnaK suppressor protein